MNPLALMTIGLAPVPTYRPKTENDAPEAARQKTREADRRRAELLEMIGRDGPMSKQEVRAAFMLCEKTIERYILSLCKQGAIASRMIDGRVYYWRPWR